MKFYTSILALSFVFLAGCSSDSVPCSDASNIDNPECQKEIPEINERPVTLEIIFDDSVYYDRNSNEWTTLSKSNLEGGLIPGTVPIYSNFLNTSKEDALNIISLAKDQNENPNSYAEASFSDIPYIEVNYEENVDYIYNYVKRDLNNQIIFETTGQMLIQDDKAYLPLINDMFENQFYPANSTLGSRFINSISIAAQSKNKQGTRTLNIEFESLLRVPNIDFSVAYSSEVQGYNLQNRFGHYYKDNIDSNPNDEFKFFTLEEIKDLPEQIPLDIRVIFQEPPKLEITQELFFEMPLDLDALKTNDEAVIQRGNSFYVKRADLDSTKDFRMKIKMNNQQVSLLNDREFLLNNVPAGTPFDIEFFYDFTQNSAYSSLSGKPLITPLKPVCNEIKGTAYQPLQESGEKNTAIANGGFLSICHPETNDKLIISSSDLSTTPFELSDTWYDYFSYVPYNEFKNDLGHFYGVRRVTFKTEGCLRLFTKEPGDPTYELKTNTSEACEIAGSSNNEGWAKYYAERTFTIFDNLSDFEGVQGLQSLMQFFGNQPIRTTPNFKFNGDINEVNHIY